jgi:hypothetical protein
MMNNSNVDSIKSITPRYTRSRFLRTVTAVTLMSAAAAMAFVASPLVGREQGSTPNIASKFGPRSFYLTRTGHDGNEVLTACAAGYHMASMWEIVDPSNLSYNTELGLTQDDSGSGPPSGESALGWVRTGRISFSGPGIAGQSNCNNWTTDADGHWGTIAWLSDNWLSAPTTWPFRTDPGECISALRVWCMQD